MPTTRDTDSSKASSGLADRFYRVGGMLCVDFGNTVLSYDNKEDAIKSWPELVDFLGALGIVRANQIDSLKRLEQSAPEDAARTLQGALELRQGIREAVEALANRKNVSERSVQAVNRMLRLTEGYDQLAPSSGGWAMQFVQREKRLEWLLAAIARSAADLIIEGRKAPVRKCANPDCILYFYDASRTGKRRWCSMAACGNRNKVAAFARRQRRKRG